MWNTQSDNYGLELAPVSFLLPNTSTSHIYLLFIIFIFIFYETNTLPLCALSWSWLLGRVVFVELGERFLGMQTRNPLSIGLGNGMHCHFL